MRKAKIAQDQPTSQQENPCKDKWHGEHVKPMCLSKINRPSQRTQQNEMQAEARYLRG